MNRNDLRVGLLTFCLLCITFTSAQSRKVADRYFDEFSYEKAANLYKALYLTKNNDSKHVLTRLADSYYNNANTEEAEVWYKKLIDKYGSNVSDDYLFKYALVLRSNEKYVESDSILKSLKSLSDNIVNSGLESSKYIFENSEMKDKKISIRNLAINTEFSDYGGFIVDRNVYYTSSLLNRKLKQDIYNWNNQPFLNIYKAEMNIETLDESKRDTILTLSVPSLVSEPVRSKYHEGKPSFTKDGKTMYFTRNNYDGRRLRKGKKSEVGLKIYKASLINGVWSDVTELPFNSNSYTSKHPVLSPDEKVLYFSSDMPGGYGMSDLYKVEIYGDNNYGVPENLGDKINTIGEEKWPFIGEDGTLYFSSNGHTGLGLLDIFQTKMDETSAVVNLGAPINSTRDDFAFFIDEDGKYGFFSSNRKKGKGDDDIYSFYIYSDPPLCRQDISGYVLNEQTREPIGEAIVSMLNEDGEIIDEVLTDSEGKYVLNSGLCESTYRVKASKFDHVSSATREVTIPKERSITDLNLTLVPLVIDNQIVIRPIFFDLDEYVIRDDAKYELEKIYTVMSNHPEVVLRIESHTDSRGTDAYNMKLSNNRAIATKDYLLERGLGPDRIRKAEGFGESKLLNDCDNRNQSRCTEEEHEMNRRSYFYVVEGQEAIKVRQEEERRKAIKRIEERRESIKKLRSASN